MFIRSSVESKAILSGRSLAAAASKLRRRGKKIVFTNGCFDLFHIGHARYLEQARAFGDILVVGVNSDASVRKLKGPGRPILKLRDRMSLLSHLRSVDYVVPFAESTPLRLIRLCRPEVLIKGGDWAPERIVGCDFVQAYGGRVISGIQIKGISTTDILQTILGFKEFSRRATRG